MPSQPTLHHMSDEEATSLIAAALRESGGGQITREGDLFLAGICADRLHERLAVAGVVFLRRVD